MPFNSLAGSKNELGPDAGVQPCSPVRGAVGPIDRASYRVIKRVFDVLFSALLLLLGSPLLVTIAICVKLTSRGPVFFRQERIGRDGRHFMMLKFRSMRVADASQTDKAWRAENDPRITWLGAFLRRTNLDEMPQFFNVLKGEMSVVGPRPERPFFVQEFSQAIAGYNLRHAGEVGITGWAQVNGWRGDTAIASRVNCDLEYYQNWSLALDLRIIWLTILWRGRQASIAGIRPKHVSVQGGVGDIPYLPAHFVGRSISSAVLPLQPSISANRK